MFRYTIRLTTDIYYLERFYSMGLWRKKKINLCSNIRHNLKSEIISKYKNKSQKVSSVSSTFLLKRPTPIPYFHPNFYTLSDSSLRGNQIRFAFPLKQWKSDPNYESLIPASLIRKITFLRSASFDIRYFKKS